MRSGGPRSDHLDNVQFGLHYAVVCQNQDPEQLGRVKVRLPWLQDGDQDQTQWAQLLTPMEGKEFGWYALPDIDDVVVVTFIAGDIARPVIIGGVWSKADVAPEPNADGANNFRGYRSRAGHRLIFDDSAQTKLVFAGATAKHMLGLGAFDKAGAGPNVCAIFRPPMAGKAGISMSALEGALEVTCKDGALRVEAGEHIKLAAKTTIDITGAEIKVEGSSAAKVTSGSPSNYDAPKIDVG